MLILPGADTWLSGGTPRFREGGQAVPRRRRPRRRHLRGHRRARREGLLDDRRHTSNAPEFLQAFGYQGTDLYATPGGHRSATSSPPGHRARGLRARSVRGPRPVRRPRSWRSGTSSTASATRPGYYELDGAANRSAGRQELLSRRALAVFRLNGQFLEVAEGLARPAGLTAAHWQVLGAVLDEPLPVAGHRPRDGHHPPGRAAHRRPPRRPRPRRVPAQPRPPAGQTGRADRAGPGGRAAHRPRARRVRRPAVRGTGRRTAASRRRHRLLGELSATLEALAAQERGRFPGRGRSPPW